MPKTSESVITKTVDGKVLITNYIISEYNFFKIDGISKTVGRRERLASENFIHVKRK
jgi:hypothetical protein